MEHRDNDSTLIAKGPCIKCPSSDAFAFYSDGHSYCFSCGHYEHAPGDEQDIPNSTSKRTKRKPPVSGLIQDIEVRGLRTRKITDATCQHFGYGIGTYKGKEVHVAPYYDKDGRLVAQHLRTRSKDFPWLGEPKQAVPFGYHAFPKSGRMLTLVEGEIDCLSMSQVQGNKWPVWSIGCGAGPQIRKYIARHRDLFLQFEKVVIMFDSDEPGREASKIAAEVIGDRALIAHLPLKDPNDMLKEGRVEELIQAMWRATPYRPDGLVELRDLRDEVFKPVEWGLPWIFDSITKMTYGRRLGEIYCFGAGTGTGKTDVLTQQIVSDIVDHGLKVGAFLFEQQPRESALRLTSKAGRKPFHIPDGEWTEAERAAAWESIEQAKGRLYLYDSFGTCDWALVQEHIRFLHHSEGVEHFYVDHLTAFAAHQEDERKALELIMSEMGSLVKELNIALYLVSHLATPDGKPHEEGGRVMIRHFKGSRAIGFWCHFMFGLERNQQAEDELERRTTTFRCLKDRYTGRATGAISYLRYDPVSAMLVEVDKELIEAAGMFQDETADPQTTHSDF